MTTPNHHAPAAAAAEVFNELDPHGFDHGHTGHGHTIVGPFTLRSVLTALLALTVLTVFLAQAEVWAEGYFHITLPWWVNVVGAMTIAVIKAVLVMAFFMQLKYDSPINTVLMLFCFAALAIFLGFSGMDLFNRDAVDPLRNTYKISGGDFDGGKPLVVGAADRLMETLKKRHNGDEAAAKAAFEEMREIMHKAHGHVEAPEPMISTAGKSRRKGGLTDALSPVPAGKDEHGTENKGEPEKHADAR
jgi:cytochrome c oxidase subunit 4